MSTRTKVLAVAALLLAGLLVATRWWDSETPRRRAGGGIHAEAAAPEAPSPPAPVAVADATVRGDCPVRVVGADDHGIGTAQVTAVREEKTEVRGTDATGLVRFGDAGPAVLWVSAAGHALTRVERTLSADETRVTLGAGGLVQLVFEDRHGAAVPGAEVRRRYEEKGLPPTVCVLPQEVFDWWDDPTHASLPLAEGAWQCPLPLRWNADGAEVGLLAPGGWRVFLARPGATDRLSDPFTVASGGTTRVRVTLPAADTRRVRFVGESSGQPLPGTRARAVFRAHWEMATLAGVTLVADERGEVELPLTPARGEVGCRWQFDTDGWSGAIGAEAIEKAKEAPIEVRLWPTWSVRGTAFLANGEPAAHGKLFCVDLGRTQVTRADEAGRFAFSGLARGDGDRLGATLLLVESLSPPLVSKLEMGGEPWRFGEAGPRLLSLRRASMEAGRAARLDRGNKELAQRYEDLSRQYGEAEAEARRSSPTEFEVRIGAPSGDASGRVEGRITTGGLPLPGVSVAVSTQLGTRRAVTDGSGSFAIGQVAGERCQVYISWGEHPGVLALLRGDDIELPAGGIRRLDFDLPTGEIAVHVVDAATGRPIPRLRVSAGLVDVESQVKRFEGFYFIPGWAAVTDVDGNARLRCLAPGEPHVVVVNPDRHADPYEAKQLGEVRPGSADEPLRLEVRLGVR